MARSIHRRVAATKRTWATKPTFMLVKLICVASNGLEFRTILIPCIGCVQEVVEPEWKRNILTPHRWSAKVGLFRVCSIEEESVSLSGNLVLVRQFLAQQYPAALKSYPAMSSAKAAAIVLFAGSPKLRLTGCLQVWLKVQSWAGPSSIASDNSCLQEVCAVVSECAPSSVARWLVYCSCVHQDLKLPACIPIRKVLWWFWVELAFKHSSLREPKSQLVPRSSIMTGAGASLWSTERCLYFAEDSVTFMH